MKKNKIKPYLPLLVILVIMAVAYFSGFLDMFTLEYLKKHRMILIAFVNMYPILGPLIFIICYILVAALSLPVGIYLTLLGGFLFSQPWCTLYVVLGATLGASCLFLATRTALQDLLHAKTAPFLSKKMSEGFKQNAWSYMLSLRLIPLFPFWLVNLAPAFLNVPFFTFFWTTAIGIIPATFAFTQVGAGLGAILDSDGPLNLTALLNHEVKIALIALGIVALLPVIIKQFSKKEPPHQHAR